MKKYLSVLIFVMCFWKSDGQIIAGQPAAGIHLDSSFAFNISSYFPSIFSYSKNVSVECDTNTDFIVHYYYSGVHYPLNDITQVNFYITIVDTNIEIRNSQIAQGTLINENIASQWVDSIYSIYSCFWCSGIQSNFGVEYIPIRKKYGNEYLYGWCFAQYLENFQDFYVSLDYVTKFPKNLTVLYDTITCNSAYTFANGVTLYNIYHDTVYDFVLPSSTVGCDSLIKTRLKVDLSNFVNNYDTVCIGTNYTFIDGSSAVITTDSFVHQNAYIAQNGCDSVIETILKIRGTYDTVNVLTICGSSYLFPDSNVIQNISADTSHTSHFINIYGCDSLITTKILSVPIYNPIEYVHVCYGANYTFPDGFTISNIMSGQIYQSHFLTVNDCDSVVQTCLLLNTIDTSILQNSNEFIANAMNVSYQWYDCNANQLLIGDTNKIFIATQNGSYAVILSDGNCTDTSACHSLTNLSVQTAYVEYCFSVYPNPSSSKFQIKTSLFYAGAKKELYNSMGQLIVTTKENEIDTKNLSRGIYYLRMAEFGIKVIVE